MKHATWHTLGLAACAALVLFGAGCGESRTPAVTASVPAAPVAEQSQPAADSERIEVAGESPAETPSTESVAPPRPIPSAPIPADRQAGTSQDAPHADLQRENVRVASSDAGRAGYDAKKPKLDPIEINGKYFEGWPKPKLAIVMGGRQDGYLEPCGCAGLDQQKGGISRRFTFLHELEDRGWPTVALDVGGLVRRFGRQQEVKFAIAADALKQSGFRGVGFGPDDLRLSAGEIVAAVAGQDPQDSIFVSANVSLFDLTPKTRIVEAGGLKVGITSVLGDEYRQQVNNDEVTMTPAAEALEKVVGELAQCDVRVLLAHATVEESRELAKKFPQFGIVVTSDGRDIPPLEPELIEGTKTRLVEVAPKGMYLVVAGFYDDRAQPVRFQRVALDSRFADAPQMRDLMATYQDQLKQLGWNELGIKPVPHPRAAADNPQSGQFAGAQSCRECHPTAYGIWSKTKHAHATETLTKLDPPRHFDSECVSCHATGWNPQEYYPFASGFDSLETTPGLAGNQCENCHGPAAAHVAAEAGRNTKRKDDERQKLKLTAGLAFENVCIKCHDHDNSPEFNEKSFEAHYWPKVEHKGKK